MPIHQKKDFLERQFEELGKVLAMMLAQVLDKDPPAEESVQWEQLENGLRALGLLGNSKAINEALLTEKLERFSTMELQNLLSSLKKLNSSAENHSKDLETAIAILSDYLASSRNYADWGDLF